MTLKSKPTMRPSERYRGRVEFFEVREEVFELAAKGYSRLVIYRHMFEKNRFTMSYRCFCNYFERETVGQPENTRFESSSRQQVKYTDLKSTAKKIVHENKLNGNQSSIPEKKNQSLLNSNEIDLTKNFVSKNFASTESSKPNNGKYLDLSGNKAQVISKSTDSDTQNTQQ